MRSIPLIRRLAPIAALVLLAACATDGGSAGGDTISRDEWCATVGDVDKQFKAVDTSDDDFAGKQAAYEQIGELIAELEDGITVVDASDRDDVRTSLAWASRLTEARVAAEDEQDAERRLEPFYADTEGVSAGAPWILKNCGVDIDS